MEELCVGPKNNAEAAAAALVADCEQCGGYRIIVDGVIRCGTCGWPAGVEAPRRAQAVPPSVAELLTKRVEVLERENEALRKLQASPARIVTDEEKKVASVGGLPHPPEPVVQERQAVPPQRRKG